MHAYCVVDSIRELHETTALQSDFLRPEARFYLLYGASRRAKSIWSSLRRLLYLIDPSRSDPPPRDEVSEASQCLNVIYIDIRGLLDNLAWALLKGFADDKAQSLGPTDIHLFSGKFLKLIPLIGLLDLSDEFREWHRDMKERRDPAAHRIPLSVVPALLGPSEQAKYRELYQQFQGELNSAARSWREGGDPKVRFKRADELSNELENIGTFFPLFSHHPEEGAIKIYPTVPQDVGMLVKLSRKVLSLMRSASGQAS
jgi:hypothetical protein